MDIDDEQSEYIDLMDASFNQSISASDVVDLSFKQLIGASNVVNLCVSKSKVFFFLLGCDAYVRKTDN